MDVHVTITVGSRRVDDDGRVTWRDGWTRKQALVSCTDEGKPRDEVLYQVKRLLEQMDVK